MYRFEKNTSKWGFPSCSSSHSWLALTYKLKCGLVGGTVANNHHTFESVDFSFHVYARQSRLTRTTWCCCGGGVGHGLPRQLGSCYYRGIVLGRDSRLRQSGENADKTNHVHDSDDDQDDDGAGWWTLSMLFLCGDFLADVFAIRERYTPFALVLIQVSLLLVGLKA